MWNVPARCSFLPIAMATPQLGLQVVCDPPCVRRHPRVHGRDAVAALLAPEGHHAHLDHLFKEKYEQSACNITVVRRTALTRPPSPKSMSGPPESPAQESLPATPAHSCVSWSSRGCEESLRTHSSNPTKGTTAFCITEEAAR